MNLDIKTIEDLSLNAWPSHQMELYDGWILRFSYFYTHRTNSVEQFGNSMLSWREKIPYCESIYQRWGTPTIFKISPLVSKDFDYVLENRNYEIQNVTRVMVLDIEDAVLTANADMVRVEQRIPNEWIEALFELKHTTNPVHRAIVPTMYQAIAKDTVCVSIERDGEIIGTGLGILDREYIGIYAIHVREDYRSQGYARAICTCILNEGKKKGAKKAYLQVVAGNEIAYKLYESLGFEEYYTYYFRVST
ncbi:MAG: family N-acetyltransferase [Herbinix sp.]|jgi:ribosomal protein S18 acetylase RimI-like enzyme|nr:family N-acetyltransferase [Herbinix sp.]